MATQPDDDQDDTLNLTEDMEVDEPDQSGDDDQQVDDQGGGEDEVDRVTFADEDEEPPEENSVIRQMRTELRETKQRLREAEQKSAPARIEIGDKPTMEGCGFDEEEFEAKLDAWKERKAAAERQEEAQAEDNRKVNEAWQQDLTAFEQKKGALSFEDRDEAIETVTASLPRNWQAAAIIKAATDPALFFYALSKSPAKLAELAKFEDPIKMAAAVARMEGAVRVVKGRKAPDPDRPATGSAQMPGGPDKQLEKLEKEAAKTGDRTQLIAYKKKLGEKGKQSA